MDRKLLSREDFDAIVTGELTHYALWLEAEVDNIMSDYFIGSHQRRTDFERLFLHRDGLTFQDKLEILNSMLSLYGSEADELSLKRLLRRVEAFKSQRNAMVHGRDVSDGEVTSELKVEIVNRAGKPKIVVITPETHDKQLEEAEKLLSELQSARERLKKNHGRT